MIRNKFCQILDRLDGIGIAGKNYDLNKSVTFLTNPTTGSLEGAEIDLKGRAPEGFSRQLANEFLSNPFFIGKPNWVYLRLLLINQNGFS